jgi:hypothetical protein
MPQKLTYAQRMRAIVGDPTKSVTGTCIDPLFTMGLPLEAVPEDRREEYASLLRIWAAQRESARKIHVTSGSADPSILLWN